MEEEIRRWLHARAQFYMSRGVPEDDAWTKAAQDVLNGKNETESGDPTLAETTNKRG